MALLFGPAEYFSLMMLGLVAVIVLAHGSLLSAVVGLLLFSVVAPRATAR
jgi:TctA family transporter